MLWVISLYTARRDYARIRNHRDQIVHCDSAHPGKQNRILDSKVNANRPVQQGGVLLREPRQIGGHCLTAVLCVQSRNQARNRVRLFSLGDHLVSWY